MMTWIKRRTEDMHTKKQTIIRWQQRRRKHYCYTHVHPLRSKNNSCLAAAGNRKFSLTHSFLTYFPTHENFFYLIISFSIWHWHWHLRTWHKLALYWASQLTVTSQSVMSWWHYGSLCHKLLMSAWCQMVLSGSVFSPAYY